MSSKSTRESEAPNAFILTTDLDIRPEQDKRHKHSVRQSRSSSVDTTLVKNLRTCNVSYVVILLSQSQCAQSFGSCWSVTFSVLLCLAYTESLRTLSRPESKFQPSLLPSIQCHCPWYIALFTLDMLLLLQ